MAKLAFVGFSFYGLHGMWFYWYVQPYYVKTLLPLLTKTVLRWHKVAFSTFFDTVVYNVPYISMAYFYLGLINHKGNAIEAWNDLKN